MVDGVDMRGYGVTCDLQMIIETFVHLIVVPSNTKSALCAITIKYLDCKIKIANK